MEKVLLQVDLATEELVEEWLWSIDALSVGSLPPDRMPRELTALFDPFDRDVFEATLKEAAATWSTAPLSISYETVREEAWQETWRENFKPFDCGRFRIVGEWEDVPDDHWTLRVYPGQAFGTGQHETTQLILERVSELDLTGQSVFDAGCGTGILAIGAERQGAESAFGYDIDPDCDENMQRHIAINQATRTKLAIGQLGDFQLKAFDLILANITINVLTELWPSLFLLLKSGGRILSSGILESQREEAKSKLEGTGFRIVDVRTSGEWVMFEATR